MVATTAVMILATVVMITGPPLVTTSMTCMPGMMLRLVKEHGAVASGLDIQTFNLGQKAAVSDPHNVTSLVALFVGAAA